MKTQRYKLLTTLIVSALHPNEVHQTGTVWAPSNRMDILEAEDLVKSGYAEKTNDTKASLASLALDRKEAARQRQAAIDRGEDPDAGAASAPVVTDTSTSDDEVLSLILEGSVDQVVAELEGLTEAQLQRLAELEAGENGKKRKGVAEAVEAAVEALGE